MQVRGSSMEEVIVFIWEVKVEEIQDRAEMNMYVVC